MLIKDKNIKQTGPRGGKTFANVNVCYRNCLSKKCYHAGLDKGSFITGRGYVDYHATPKWVCMTRHLYGCPDNHNGDVHDMVGD